MNTLIEQMKEVAAKIRGESWGSVVIDVTHWSGGRIQTEVRVQTADRAGNGETVEDALAAWDKCNPLEKMLSEAAAHEATAAKLRAKVATGQAKAAELEKGKQ